LKVALDEATRETLERVYASPECAKDKEKAQVLLLATEGIYTYERLAQIGMRSRATVVNWVAAFGKGGLPELLGHAPGAGRPSEMGSPEVVGEIERGLERGRWVTAGQVREWLKREYGILRAESTVRYWLGKLGGAPKVPRPVHAKKDEAEAEAFKAHLFERLSALDIPAGSRVRVWAADEARYGLHDRLRRCWGRRGVRLVKRMQMDYEWGYLYGAMDVVAGESEFLIMPSVGLPLTRMFLAQLASRDPGAHHVVIWDNAGFHHRPGDPSLPPNIHLLPLPPYSPELNPAERLWDMVRDMTSNVVHGTIGAMDDAVAAAAKTFYDAPDRVRSLVGNGWLHVQANAS
jgi:transposase